MTIEDMVAKRRARWTERGDTEYDRLLTAAAAEKVLSDPYLRAEIYDRPYKLIELCFTVVDKESRTVPFFLNDVQADFIKQVETRGTERPFFILKGRQQGFTTLITAIQLSYAIVRKNFSGFTMADRTDNTKTIFNDKARTVLERLPELLRPKEKFNSVNELFFDKLNSSWRVATATPDVGRSRTLNFVHFSEVAFYDCSLSAIQAGIGEAITQGALRVYETTANGFNSAKDLWDSGSCVNLFYEWWRTAEYACADYEYIENADAWLTARIKTLEEKGLTREQIAWYARKYDGYIDKALIRQEYPCTPEEAFVSSGECVFDRDALSNRLATLVSAPRVGYFEYDRRTVPITKGADTVGFDTKIENVRFVEDKGGYIRIDEEPQVKKDEYGNAAYECPYALGGDTAGSGTDFYTAKVVNVITKKTAATLQKKRMDDDLYAEQLYCLGLYYNKARIAVELNFSRQPTRVLADLNYPNMYVRRDLKANAADTPQKEYGFLTTARTKPIIVNNLVTVLRDNADLESDRETLKELLSFVRKDGGKTEAVSGAHDDLVMALAIAHFVAADMPPEWKDVRRDYAAEIMKQFQNAQPESGQYIDW